MKPNKIKRERKKVCSHCGYEENLIGVSMGAVDGRSYFGNHSCLDGEMGTFYEKETN